MYSCHLFLISSASVRSIPFLSFIELIFVKCSLGISNFPEEISSFPNLLFSSISLQWSLRKAFLSLIYSLELCIQMLISFLFSFAFFSLLFTGICKASHTAILLFCISSPWGWSWSLSPIQYFTSIKKIVLLIRLYPKEEWCRYNLHSQIWPLNPGVWAVKPSCCPVSPQDTLPGDSGDTPLGVSPCDRGALPSTLCHSTPQKGPHSIKAQLVVQSNQHCDPAGKANPSPGLPVFTKGACEKDQAWDRGFQDLWGQWANYTEPPQAVQELRGDSSPLPSSHSQHKKHLLSQGRCQFSLWFDHWLSLDPSHNLHSLAKKEQQDNSVLKMDKGRTWGSSGEDFKLPVQGALIWSLVREPRSHMPWDVAKKISFKKRTKHLNRLLT